jgi:N4-gp56 family major capsid protein
MVGTQTNDNRGRQYVATTQFGVNHPLAVKLWSKKLMREALKTTWLQKFVTKGTDGLCQLDPQLKEVGDRLRYGLRMLLTGDGVQGDATLEGNEEALTFFSDDIIINQLRHAVRSDGKMSEQRVPYSIREEAMRGLADWLADRLDASFMNQLAGNTNISDTKFTGNNATIAPSNDRAIYATGTPGTDLESSLSASSIFSLTLLDRAKNKAVTVSPVIRPIRVNGEDKYVMFIHPHQHYQLRTNTNTAQYQDIQKAAIQGGQISQNPIYTGSIAEYNGIIMHESVRVPWGVSTQTNARTDTSLGQSAVARSVLCGAQAAVLSTGRQTKDSLAATWAEELFDYGNQLGVAGGLIYGLKKCDFNSLDFATITVSSYSDDPN